jgi:hypothetical protein
MSCVFIKQLKVNAWFRTRSKKDILNSKSTTKISNEGTAFQRVTVLGCICLSTFHSRTNHYHNKGTNHFMLYGTTIKYVQPSKPM